MNGLPTYWPWVLAAVIVLALGILVMLVLLVRKGINVTKIGKPPEEEEEQPADVAPTAKKSADAAMIRRAFKNARARMLVRGKGNRYSVPLVVLLGDSNSREAGFLEKSAGPGLELREDPVKEGLAFSDEGAFLFFEKGVVLDIAGEPLGFESERVTHDGTWNRIMSRLVDMRPKRPADAIVVTVSCTELLTAATDEEERLALGSRAMRLRSRLWDLQQKCGFRLPLYILVTNAELIPGFGETCAALPKHAFSEMLGWSNPNAPRITWQSDWIDDAMHELRGSLSELQMELFRSGPQRDGVLFLPWSIGTLAEPLRTFADHLLGPGARAEAAMTRGIYFCGHGPEPGSTAFIADLFSKKIFQEVGLATPTSSMRMTRSRRARVLHWTTAATAAAVFAALGFGWWTLYSRHDELKNILESAHTGINGARTMSGDEIGNAARDLLDQMSKLDFDHYSPIYLPASRITGFDRRTHMALGRAFQVVVLEATHRELMAKARHLIDEESRRVITVGNDLDAATSTDLLFSAGSTIPVQPVAKTASFVRLQAFVKSMCELEENGILFNRVVKGGSGNLQDLGTVVKYALGKELPKRFYRSAMHQAVARRLTTDLRFNAAQWADEASAEAERDAEELYKDLFHRNACAYHVAMTAALVNPSTLRMNAPGTYDNGRFKILDDTLDSLRGDLSTPDSEWAFRPTFNLGPEFNEVLTRMSRCDIFEDTTVQKLRTRGTEELHDLRLKLATRTSLGSTVLKLHPNGDPAMELSGDTLLLHNAVKTFLGQTFAAPETAALRVRSAIPGEQLQWDQGQIEQAGAAYRSYTDFHDKGSKLFPQNLPPDLNIAIEQSAQEGTRRQINDHLAKAQIFISAPELGTEPDHENQIRVDAQTFASSMKAIRTQLDALQSLRAFAARNDVITATSVEAMRLLRATDAILDSKRLYEPRDVTFASWEGRAPLAPAAWDRNDAGELREYLDTTRNYLAALATNNAAPMLEWFAEYGLPASDSDVQIVNRWRSIRNDLHNFEVKKAANPTTLLEDYISVRAAKLSPANCREAELRPPEESAHGYFADTLKRTARRVSARCKTVAAMRAEESYNELATLFMRQLAGRYPFDDEPRKSGAFEADPENVRHFYRRYDEARPLFNDVSDDAHNYAWFRPAREFIKKMDGVREFFAPYLDAKVPPRVPEVNVETAFRILPDREIGANEIIEWSLAIDDQTVTQRDKGKKLRWRPGDEVRLKLRWAADAPRVPVLPSAQRNTSIDDRAVVYRYSNTWSLLTALNDLRASADDLPTGIDDQPVTLALYVLTRPAGGGDPDPRHPSIVFMRLALSGLDGQPLELPSFPVSAAPLPRYTAEVAP